MLLVVLVLVPGLAFFGNWAIFSLFGSGHYLPGNSTGEHVFFWWNGWGRPLTVGTVTWLILLVRRISAVKSTLLAIGSGAAAFLLPYAVLIVWLMLHPGVLD